MTWLVARYRLRPADVSAHREATVASRALGVDAYTAADDPLVVLEVSGPPPPGWEVGGRAAAEAARARRWSCATDPTAVEPEAYVPVRDLVVLGRAGGLGRAIAFRVAPEAAGRLVKWADRLLDALCGVPGVVAFRLLASEAEPARFIQTVAYADAEARRAAVAGLRRDPPTVALLDARAFDQIGAGADGRRSSVAE